MTKIFYGNQYITSFKCDGKKYSRLQSIKNQIVRVTKNTLKILAIFLLATWISLGGFWYGKNNVKPQTIWAESIKEVPIAIQFEDIPMLVRICKAESGNRQFNSSGDVLRGKVNPSDLGYCQINEYIHNDTARKLGMDIFTEKGNKDYAIYLFLREGSTPWNSSKSIWNK